MPTIAIANTPLHLRSLAALVSSARIVHVDVLELVDLDPAEARNAHYLAAFRTASPTTKVIFSRPGAVASLLFGMRALRQRLRKQMPVTLVVGNPRRWHALVYGRISDEVIVLEEGIGTTRRGGYFDPSVPEKSRLKRLAVRAGLIVGYHQLLGSVRSHFTAFRTSVLPGRVHQPLRRLDQSASLQLAPGQRLAVVVSSLLRAHGDAPYRTVIERAKQRGHDFDRILFSFHPKDDRRLVERLCRQFEIEPMNSPLVLEDFLVSHLEAGVRIEAFGDWNSSIELVECSLRSEWQWVNHCSAVEQVW